MFRRTMILSLIGLLQMPVVARAEKNKPYTALQICERLVVNVDEMVFDAAGTTLRHRGRSQQLRSAVGMAGGGEEQGPSQFKDAICGFSGGIGSSSNNYSQPLYLKYEWLVKQNGSIHYVIEQFARQTMDKNSPPKFHDSVKRDEGEIKDFAPVIWVSPLHKNERLVVRMTPVLLNERPMTTLGELPISGQEIVAFDSDLQVLVRNLDVAGKYVGFSTPKGFLAISYAKFKGSEPMGVAVGNRMELSLPGKGKRITLISTHPFVPMDVKAQVYGIFDTSRRSSSITSQSISTTDNEAEFLDKLKNQNR